MSSKAVTTRAALVLAGLALLVAGCRDSAGPTSFDIPDSIAMQASVAGDNGNGIGPHTARHADTASVLESYVGSFWVQSDAGSRLSLLTPRSSNIYPLDGAVIRRR